MNFNDPWYEAVDLHTSEKMEKETFDGIFIAMNRALEQSHYSKAYNYQIETIWWRRKNPETGELLPGKWATRLMAQFC